MAFSFIFKIFFRTKAEIVLTHPYWNQFVISQNLHIIGILSYIALMIFGTFGNLMIILFHLRFELSTVTHVIIN